MRHKSKSCLNTYQANWCQFLVHSSRRRCSYICEHEESSFKRLVSKYFPVFLAYLFWGLVILGLGTGFYYIAEMDKLSWRETASFNKSSLEEQRALQSVILRRVFSEVFRNVWYYPLVLTVITVGIVENWPSRNEEESQDDGRGL